jgi:hypothetical protein
MQATARELRGYKLCTGLTWTCGSLAAAMS